MLQVDYAIAGSGVSGLTAALVIKSLVPDARVLVMDMATQVGGLLRSVQHEGLSFDLGTHIPELTPNADLNKLLFPSEIDQDWQSLDHLKVGNFFRQHMNHHSQFVNLDRQEEDFCLSLVELLQACATQEPFVNLQEALVANYGQSLTHQVFAPLMYKMTAHPLADLATGANIYYGLSRISVGDDHIARQLKQIPHLDRTLSFKTDAERPRISQWLYPKQGIGAWIHQLHQSCLAKGVTFLMNTKIQQVQEIQSDYHLLTTLGQTVKSSELVWTLPFYSAFVGGESSYYQSRSIAIYHFYSEQPANTTQHYVYCQQANMHSYRLTFYDNVTPNDGLLPYRVSVEVIYDREFPRADRIREELVVMGLYDHKEQVVCAGIDHLSSGFPVPLTSVQAEQSRIYSQMKKQYPRVLFTGRGKRGLFFTNEVLLDVYQQISEQVQGGVFSNDI